MDCITWVVDLPQCTLWQKERLLFLFFFFGVWRGGGRGRALLTDSLPRLDPCCSLWLVVFR